MRQKFLSSVFIVLILNALFKPIWILFVDRYFQNTVGNEAYGLYFTLFNFSLIFNIFLDLGISNFNQKNIAQYPHLLPKYFHHIFFIKIILGFFYLGLILFSALFFSYSREAIIMLLWLAFNQFLSSLIIYLRSNVSALQKFVLDGVFSVLDKFFMILICGVLIILHKIGSLDLRIDYLVYSQTISFIITAICILIFTLSQIGEFKFKVNIPFGKLIFKQSFYFALYVLIVTIYLRADVVMLEYFLEDGTTQAGIYAQASRLIDVFSILGLLFAGILLPLLSHKLAEKNTQEIQEIIKTSATMLIFSSIIVAVFCTFYSSEIMELLYDKNVSESTPILKYLCWLFVFTSFHYIYSTLLTANGNIKELCLISILGLIVSFGLNYFLIPRWHGIGIAITAVVTNFIVTILILIVTKKNFGYLSFTEGLMKKILFLLFLVFLAFLSKKLPSDFWVLNGLFYIGIAFSTGILFKIFPNPLLLLKRKVKY